MLEQWKSMYMKHVQQRDISLIVVTFVDVTRGGINHSDSLLLHQNVST